MHTHPHSHTCMHTRSHTLPVLSRLSPHPGRTLATRSAPTAMLMAIHTFFLFCPEDRPAFLRDQLVCLQEPLLCPANSSVCLLLH